jgi:hypothetical protein
MLVNMIFIYTGNILHRCGRDLFGHYGKVFGSISSTQPATQMSAGNRCRDFLSGGLLVTFFNRNHLIFNQFEIRPDLAGGIVLEEIEKCFAGLPVFCHLEIDRPQIEDCLFEAGRNEQGLLKTIDSRVKIQ